LEENPKGRYTLKRTLRSIRHLTRDDEVIVVSDGKQPIAKAVCQIIRPQVPFRLRFLKGPKTNMVGSAQRNLGMKKAKGDWLLFMDDDDIYVPDAFIHIRQALKGRKPHIFRMLNCHNNREILWRKKRLVLANIGTPMLCIPNDADFIGPWWPDKRAADFDFIRALVKRWPKKSIVWRREVICIVRPSE
jgi:glycosyltransferase involved in cell wall biosynthesis